jgi:hypothetical protein
MARAAFLALGQCNTRRERAALPVIALSRPAASPETEGAAPRPACGTGYHSRLDALNEAVIRSATGTPGPIQLNALNSLDNEAHVWSPDRRGSGSHPERISLDISPSCRRSARGSAWAPNHTN